MNRVVAEDRIKLLTSVVLLPDDDVLTEEEKIKQAIYLMGQELANALYKHRKVIIRKERKQNLLCACVAVEVIVPLTPEENK